MLVTTDRGSEWAKWDLHVHTPESLTHDYDGVPSDQVWNSYLDELEALPAEFAVLGINDYWFLDGYARIIKARDAGRLQNIRAFFPVLELRLDQFGGVDGHLSRANLHVIFDPSLDPRVIQEQFIAAMSSGFRLAPGAGASWSGILSRQALMDLGAAIKKSAPEDAAATMGSDIVAGFNNLVVSLETVEALLRNSYFKGRAILALGKTEWADIKWQAGSIASKKDLVNSARLLFTAFDDPASWSTQRQKLTDAGVNNNLIDCSDAHTWSSRTDVKDRIGNCSTWVRAEPTFSGLLHALTEFEERVHVGTEPSDLVRQRTAPERIIDSVTIRPRATKEGRLFEYKVSLNAGLVAVIGNKGQGKSALLDCIARAGNSSRGTDFGFLNSQRFLHPRTGQGQDYEVEVEWLGGQKRTVGLDQPFDPASLEAVEYLPQALIERICSSDPSSSHRDAFDAELKRVIFHHIPRSAREGQTDLDSLHALRARRLELNIEAHRTQLLSQASEYLSLETRSSDLNPTDLRARLDLLKEALLAVDSELVDAQASLDTESASDDAALVSERTRLAELDAEVSDAVERDARDSEVVAERRQRLTQLDALGGELSLFEAHGEQLDARFREFLAAPNRIVAVETDQEAIAGGLAQLRSDVQLREEAMAGRAQEVNAIRGQRDQLINRLQVTDANREALRRRVEQLNSRKSQLMGNADEPDTIRGVEYLVGLAEGLPERLAEARKALRLGAEAVHRLTIQQLEVIRELYAPAASFVSSDDLAHQAEIEFEARMEVGSAYDGWTNSLDGRRTSDLLDHLSVVRTSLDLSSTEEVGLAVDAVIARLSLERGSASGTSRAVAAAFRRNVDVAQMLADWVGLRWIETRFALTGRGLPLDQLSPGQRGLVLLLFYLSVDRADSPILVDQPEENLDSDTVRRLVVPALKRARKRRQVVVVTHSPNLAVVGDADQIISCVIEDDSFKVVCGSLAGSITGQTVINVLEGGWGAVENRQEKYGSVVGPQ